MVKSKKQMFLVIISFILVLMLGTISYAFFNYTRTGSSNNVRVGRVNFSSSENNTINLTNVFPTDSSHLDNTNSSTVTINITGDTNYDKGIEYKVSIVDVQNIVNNKEVPISFSVSASNLGTKSSDYYDERGSTTNVYNLVESGIANNNKDIVIGYIKPDNQGVNGSINVTAFIDKDEVGISDTVSRIENNNLVYGETDSGWIDGRTILTTTEWNGLATNGISFKIKVEANEGVWVEEPVFNVLKNISEDSEWTSVRDSVTSIEFHVDGIAPENYINSFDATDLSSEGSVTLYIKDDELGNNTYKAIVVANDVIYGPEDALGMFAGMTVLTDFDTTNFKVDNTENMRAIFNKDENLADISFLANWNVSNVTDMYGAFNKCSSIQSLDVFINWDVSNVTTMYRMFYECTGITDVNGLVNWNTKSLQSIGMLFYGCTSLSNIDGLANWNTSQIISAPGVFYNCFSLTNISVLANWDTSLFENISCIFYDCSSLLDFSPISNWDTSNIVYMNALFALTSATNDITLDASIFSDWNVSKAQDMSGMFVNRNLLSYLPFRNWDVSDVQDFTGMFNATPSSTITTLEGLENWDISSATTLVGMFQDNSSLEDASAINDWNINSNMDFSEMFHHTNVHPEFTKVAGTWDENGTFTPAP